MLLPVRRNGVRSVELLTPRQHSRGETTKAVANADIVPRVLASVDADRAQRALHLILEGHEEMRSFDAPELGQRTRFAARAAVLPRRHT